MSNTKLENIFSEFIDPQFSEKINYSEYQYWLESTVEINKPDFVMLFNIHSKNPIIYSKNYNLKNKHGKEYTVSEIIKSVDIDQKDKIIEADKLCLRFIENNKNAMNNTVLQMRFTSCLDQSKPKSLIRSISFIPQHRNGKSYTLLLVTLTDITDFLGIKSNASAGVRYISGSNVVLNRKLEQLKIDLNAILHKTVQLTKREKQILKLIGLGKTSDNIASDLHISVNTVNTHRQNLIRKFKVRSTSALINLV